MSEQWRKFPPYKGRSFPGYEVSSSGRVRNNKGRILSQQQSRRGDGRLGRVVAALYLHGMRYRVPVGWAVLTAFRGTRPAGKQVSHKNDDQWNNKLSNLAWETPKQNADRRTDNGRTAMGELCGTAKLSDKQVERLRAEYKKTMAGAIPGSLFAGDQVRLLAMKYGITPDHVRRIAAGEYR